MQIRPPPHIVKKMTGLEMGRDRFNFPNYRETVTWIAYTSTLQSNIFKYCTVDTGTDPWMGHQSM